ncbi:MAG: CBS domain-containing protein [Candidatus Magasanikbacteria bacterium]|nr:CBS domain-containing protein [Candidatus Magasanikbacteria bacterium]
MKVKELMDTNKVSVTPGTTYEEVARLLYTNQLSGVPVIDDKDQVVGFVSEKDIVRILYPWYKSFYDSPESYTDMEARESKAGDIRNTKVEVFMKRNILTVTPDDPIMKAGALMLAHDVNRLPVVENGKVVGVVSRDSIYKVILKKNFGL